MSTYQVRSLEEADQIIREHERKTKTTYALLRSTKNFGCVDVPGEDTGTQEDMGTQGTRGHGGKDTQHRVRVGHRGRRQATGHGTRIGYRLQDIVRRTWEGHGLQDTLGSTWAIGHDGKDIQALDTGHRGSQVKGH